MLRSIALILGSLTLGVALPALGMGEAQAQTPRSQQAPAHRQAAPSPGTGAPGARGGADRSNPAGTRLPSYAQPSRPSSSSGQSRGGTTAPGGQMQTNNNPGVPGDPNQVPLGGAEWLAAAGAAYALNRLRKEEGEPDNEESDDTP